VTRILAQASNLTRLPLWAFHGGSDPTGLPARTIDTIEAIRHAGGHPKMIIYPGVNHDSWIRAFKDPHVCSWLFTQRRNTLSNFA
jgi:hypothetical protein